MQFLTNWKEENLTAIFTCNRRNTKKTNNNSTVSLSEVFASAEKIRFTKDVFS